MKNRYIISAQFANNSPFDEEAQATIKEAIVYYNTRSLMAKNPKQIINYRFSEDKMTLFVNLKSEVDLEMPTKALRLLSSYLVKNTALRNRISGKQLFKMTTVSPSEAEPHSPKQNDDDDTKVMSIKEFKSFCAEDRLEIIYELLCKIWRKL